MAGLVDVLYLPSLSTILLPSWLVNCPLEMQHFGGPGVGMSMEVVWGRWQVGGWGRLWGVPDLVVWIINRGLFACRP